MLTTNNLGEAAGVQHAGLQDRTTSNTVQGITHGLIIGKFKRGRTDQPMRINKDNIKARLGYEPANPFYQVVQDCLDKFPSVWVLRVADAAIGQGISCDGATNWFIGGVGLGANFENPTVPLTGIKITINGTVYESGIPPGLLNDYDLPEDYPMPPGIEGGALSNATDSNLRFEYQLLPENQDQYTLAFYGDNPCIIELGPNHWGVCLSPTIELPISCDGATNTTWFTDGSGTWDIEVNGTLYKSPESWGLGYFLMQEPTLSGMFYATDDGEFIIGSKLTDRPVRVKLIRQDGRRWEIHELNENPTVSIDENGDISFCLIPAAIVQPPSLTVSWAKDVFDYPVKPEAASFTLETANLDSDQLATARLINPDNAVIDEQTFDLQAALPVFDLDLYPNQSLMLQVEAVGLDGSTVIASDAIRTQGYPTSLVKFQLNKLINDYYGSRDIVLDQSESIEYRDRHATVTINSVDHVGNIREILKQHDMIYRSSQENNNDHIIENLSDEFRTVIIAAEGSLFSSRNTNPTAEVKSAGFGSYYHRFRLAPRTVLEVIIDQNVTSKFNVGKGYYQVGYSQDLLGEFPHLPNQNSQALQRYINLYEAFQRVYFELVPKPEFKVRFVFKENTYFVNKYSISSNPYKASKPEFKIGSGAHETILSGGSPAYFSPLPIAQSQSAASNQAMSYEDRMTSAIYVGVMPTVPGYENATAQYAWNNAKLEIVANGFIAGQGGAGGGSYVLDSGVVGVNGLDGYPAISNYNTDCDLRFFVNHTAEIYSGGGGGGVSASENLSVTIGSGQSDYYIGKSFGAGGAPYGLSLDVFINSNGSWPANDLTKTEMSSPTLRTGSTGVRKTRDVDVTLGRSTVLFNCNVAPATGGSAGSDGSAGAITVTQLASVDENGESVAISTNEDGRVEPAADSGVAGAVYEGVIPIKALKRGGFVRGGGDDAFTDRQLLFLSKPYLNWATLTVDADSIDKPFNISITLDETAFDLRLKSKSDLVNWLYAHQLLPSDDLTVLASHPALAEFNAQVPQQGMVLIPIVNLQGHEVYIELDDTDSNGICLTGENTVVVFAGYSVARLTGL